VGAVLRHPEAIARALFLPPWTALVTASAIALTKVTRSPSWVPESERLWARGLLWTWNVHVEMDWPSDLDPAGPYVVMANHTSHVDVPILFMALPFVPGFVAKKELDRVPFLSMALRAGGHVLLDRSDRMSGMRALRSAAEQIRQGNTVAIFPEGTRGDGRSLRPFKKGGFLIAKKAAVPILPVGIRGSQSVLPRGAILPQPATVRVIVGRPILPSEARSLTVDELLACVRGRLAELSGVSGDVSPRHEPTTEDADQAAAV
jgi:1-acyl-sn-glycerol-3-phosphate acyltransferase